METVEDVKELNEANGMSWFSPSTMSFFGSIIETEELIDGEFFVTSEQRPGSNDARMFTVRRVSDRKGNIETASEFQQFRSLDAAIDWIEEE